MRKLLLLLLFSYLHVTLIAQSTQKRDSLFHLLQTAKDDTNKVQLFYRLAVYYEMNNQDSATWYLQKTKALAEKLQYVRGVYLYEERSTVVSFTKGDYNAAMDHSLSGLRYARLLKDSSLVAIMLNNVAITYGYMKKYQEQLDYSLQAKYRVEQLKDSAKLSALYHGLAIAYSNLGQTRRAADAALYSIMLFEKLGKRNDFPNRVYASLGQAYTNLKLYDSAVIMYDKAIESSIAKGDKYAEIYLYMYKNDLYAKMGKFAEQLPLAEKSIALAKELQSTQTLAAAYFNMGAANFYTNKNELALKNINESIEIAKANSLGDEMQNAYMLLSYIYVRQGKFVEANEAARLEDSIKDAALNEQILHNTTELETKYETEKKNEQIKLQQAVIKQKNTLNYLLIGGTVALLLIIILLYLNYRHAQKLQQQRIAELETQQQLTATEAVLKGEEQERARLAKDLHDGLGGMLSGIKHSFHSMRSNLVMTADNNHSFERSIDMLDSSIREMRRVAHNMMPEALVKFGLDTALKDFCEGINETGVLQISYQSIGIQETDFNQTLSVNIFRIVQELVNNTIKHAGAKNAIIQLSKNESHVTIAVEDDGKGFDTAVLNSSQGIGWTNIKSRVKLLRATLDVQSQPGKGTSVLIELDM
ncbi:MAG: histidine kinase [Chitinophagaceae bacterium]